ncbi:unnamed protein product [Rotaria sp. Silwood2]|nr:unnamed protein product [Rotaria sp. Silwood2]
MFDVLDYIGNTFPNIIFDLVRSLSVQDGVPFEHEFFSRIAWSFPLLKELIVFNHTSQLPISNKLNSNDNQLYSTIIEYPCLTSLCLEFAHVDYVDQFLNDTKTHLPHLTKLTVSYNKLRSITKDFTNDRTRRNCKNVKRLNTDNEMRLHSKDIYAYFPLL